MSKRLLTAAPLPGRLGPMSNAGESTFHTWALTAGTLTVTCKPVCTLEHVNPSPLVITTGR